MFRSSLLFLLLLMSCGGRAVAADAMTFASQSADGLVVVAFDGAVARVYTDGELISSFPAATAQAALWGVVEPQRPLVSGARVYRRALSVSEIGALDRCSWPAPGEVIACADLGCDCTALAAR